MASPGHPTVQWVKQTGEKVDLVAFHPVLPWVAYVRRDNVVAIWNYEAEQDIYVAPFGASDEAANLESTLKQDASFVLGPERSAPSSILHGKSSSSGTVKGVGFVDADVCFWQLAKHQLHKADALSTRAVSNIAPAKHKLLSDRWLLVVCEGKIVLHSMHEPSTLEVSRALLDGKSITCATLLLMHHSGFLPSGASPHRQHVSFLPLLAVGTSAGTVFIIEPVTGTVQAVLVGGHKNSVTAVQVIPSQEARGADRLVSGASDGSIAVWEPSTGVYSPGTRREVSPRHTFKAHDSSIRGVTLMHVFKGKDIAWYLATTGDDRKVALWSVDSWTSALSCTPMAKTSFHSILYCPWAGAGLGGYPSLLLASGETPLLLGLDAETSVASAVADASSWLDPGTKKTVKIYSASAHPQRPDLFALATNTGVAILGFSKSVAPPVVALPHQLLSLDTMANMPEAPEEKATKARAAQAFTCLAASGQSLWVTHLKLESVPSPQGSSAETSVRLLQSPREVLIKLEHSGPVTMGCSPTGRSISVLWTEKGKYCVYSLTPTSTWEMVDSGSAAGLVWSTLQPQYAILRIPQVVAEAPKQKRGFFSGFGRRKPATPEPQEEAAPIPGSYVGATVQVHSIDETRAAQWIVNQGITMDGTPVALHGGALLGIVLENRPAAEGEANKRDGVQFFSWTNFTMVGPSLPAPRWVSWEPDCTALALAYEHSIELCRTTPRFEQYATLSLSDSTAAIWQSRQLYVVTPTKVFAVFTDPGQAFVQVITLASEEGMALAQGLPSAEASPLPHAVPRPVGPVVILGIRHSYLWLADSLSRPYLISLRHAGIRLRSLAARSELSTARTIAERGLGAVFHDDVARFLVALGGHEGVVEALKLSGLSPALETRLAILVEDWDRAAAAFQTMALGIKDRNLLQLVRDSGGQLLDAHAAVVAERKEPEFDPVAGILEEEEKRQNGELPAFDEPASNGKKKKGKKASEGEKVDDEDEGIEDDEPEEEVDEVEEEAEPTEIDWDAELDRPVLDPFEDHVTGSAPALVATSIAIPPGPELQALMTQGLDLADAAIQANHRDAARVVLGVFVRMAAGLPGGFLGDLVLRLGQCAMTESARSLAHAAAKGVSANLSGPGVAAPLAALIGGRNSEAVVATLTESDLAPLAAIFANVWGAEQKESATQAWQRQLDADEPHAYAHFVVTPPVV